VYRVTLRPVGLIGEAPPSIPSPRAELVVDVTDERLRARFTGAGWPLSSEAEVRIREDLPGVYLFDHRGGRPLAEGQLRDWFIGDAVRRESINVRVSPAPSEEQVGAGRLICRLLAEWSGQPVNHLMRRCGVGGAPSGFRVGVWIGRRTADVSIRLGRSALRADHHQRPSLATRTERHQRLTSEAIIRRIEPHRPLPSEDIDEADPLVLTNDEPTRLIFTVEGVPLAWIPAGTSLQLRGMRSGIYRFAALRPMGSIALRYRLVAVPGQLRVP